jgi:cell wall-associated NlpC family hydrolase
LPIRRRSLLPLVALTAIVFGCSAGAPLSDQGRGSDRRAALFSAPAAIDRATPDWTPKRPPPRPALGRLAASIALRAVGTPYRWGGASLEGGFDCSGLVHWAYRRLGVELPHSSYALYGLGRQVPRSRIQPGDVLFFSGLGHVGLYLGRGRMVHAPQTGRRVEVVDLGGSYYGRSFVGARRLLRH